MRERALKTRRIDELQAAKTPQLGQFHGDQVDLLVALRIFLFGDIAADLVERNRSVAAIAVINARLFAGAKADLRYHGRNRHDADGKDAAPDEMIQEATLAGLESSQHRDAYLVLPQR